MSRSQLIPLQHVVKMERLPYFDSDHYPILVELELVNEMENKQVGLDATLEEEEVAKEKIKKVK